ncbi:hypothetical protein [Bacillus safensis]|uniref:hypothetical protein n=1 Tax=Bacillus safensis TaxID=561879 RepID=UPI001F4E7DA0|nr:hypothetical protein [Bacillus safensis]
MEQNDQEVRKYIDLLEAMELLKKTTYLSIEIADFEKAAYYFKHGHFATNQSIGGANMKKIGLFSQLTVFILLFSSINILTEGGASTKVAEDGVSA